MRRKLLPLILGGALSIATVVPAAAQSGTDCDVTQGSRGGAAGLAALIAAAVNAQVPIAVNACDIDVDILNDSLNNLLRNANIEVLNDSLNNLLRNSDIIDDVTVNVLSGTIDVELVSGNEFNIEEFTIHLVD
jgi:hypothetical protein